MTRTVNEYDHQLFKQAEADWGRHLKLPNESYMHNKDKTKQI